MIIMTACYLDDNESDVVAVFKDEENVRKVVLEIISDDLEIIGREDILEMECPYQMIGEYNDSPLGAETRFFFKTWDKDPM